MTSYCRYGNNSLFIFYSYYEFKSTFWQLGGHFILSNYDATKKAVDDLNNNVGTPELAKLKSELNHLQSEQTALQAQVDATSSKLKAAETELANAYTKYDNNVVNFYKEVYNNTGNLDAYYAYTDNMKWRGGKQKSNSS